jgi:ATP-GRASP peptide maturase of grasp-with-spasm system
MILIISDSHDLSTTQVIEWLNLLDKQWIRINNEDNISAEFIGTDIIFTIEDLTFHLSAIKSVWHRRGFLNFKHLKSGVIEFDRFLNTEIRDLTDYVYYQLSKLPRIDSIRNAYINKLIVNDMAKDFDLIVPESYIFNKREAVNQLFINSETEYITKSISGDPIVNFKDVTVFNYTSKVRIQDIEFDSFAPSLVQNYIDKKYELRIFYFKGEFYSMAMLSQKDEQTKIDFRVYNDVKPNRRVPFNLPSSIKNKLNLLMIKLGYDTGSIDMIVTPDNEYVFLEVNPVGQFGMTSFPCNYNLEKKIAEYL